MEHLQFKYCEYIYCDILARCKRTEYIYHNVRFKNNFNIKKMYKSRHAEIQLMLKRFEGYFFLKTKAMYSFLIPIT